MPAIPQTNPIEHHWDIMDQRIRRMMTSSNGNIFHVTDPFCWEFTGPVEFPAQRPVTRSFDVFFHLRLNKRLSKQPWGWWFVTPVWSLWRHRNGFPNPPRIVQELTNALVEVWHDIDFGTIRRLIRSMPQHCKACIQARGGHTRYQCVLSIWLNEWSQFWDKSISRSLFCF